MFVNLAPTKSKGLGCAGSCGCGGTCGGGLGHGVQEYVPNSWQRMFAGYSLGGKMFPPPGMGAIDLTTVGVGTWTLIGGAGLLLMMGMKRKLKRQRSARLMRRVRGY